ncbi:MAG: SHOCT domain-containing protein [Chloroflexi bacterium]|nr:SHOCT domain-containing protein [Chloroflexota bacterium]
MFRLILGIVLMVVSVIVMIFMLQDPAGQPALADLFKDLHCGAGETVRQTVSTGGGSPVTVNGRGVFYACVNDAGTARDITDKVALTIGLGFATPFILGLLLLLSGIFGMVRGAARRAAGDMDTIGQPLVFQTGGPGRTTTVVTIQGGDIGQADLPQDAARVVQQMLDSMSGFAPTQGGDLTARLEEIKEALDKGLISQEEYDRLRRRILDDPNPS